MSEFLGCSRTNQQPLAKINKTNRHTRLTILLAYWTEG
jgi:hypothetical protein